MTNKNLAGHIDSFEGGILRGWAANLDDENPEAENRIVKFPKVASDLKKLHNEWLKEVKQK